MLSLGVDTGGAYTDAVIVDRHGEVLASAKSLTTHEQPSVGIRGALASARRAGAEQCEVTVSVEKKVATLAGGESIFVEACVSAIARGRPAHARQVPQVQNRGGDRARDP